MSERGRSRAWKWVVAALALVAAFAAVLVLLERRATAELEARIEAIRARGEPVTLDDLDLGLPDAENGAAAIVEAIVWLQRNRPEPLEPASLDDEPSEWSGRTHDEVAEYLARCEPFFALVDEAVSRPRIRFDEYLADRAVGADGMHFSGGLRTFRLLRAQVSVLTVGEDGRRRREESIRSLLQLGAKWEPVTVLDLMFALMPPRHAVDALRSALETNSIDAAALQAELEQPLRAESLPRVREALLGERAWGYAGFRVAMGDESVSVDPSAAAWMTQSWMDRLGRPVVAQETLDYLDEMAALLALPTQSHFTFAVETQRIWKRAPETPKWRQQFSLGPPSALVLSLLSRVIEQDASQRLARIALAVRATRTRTGKWPSSLGEIAPLLGGRVPLDPYTEAPFEYVVEMGLVTIRSPGPSGRDGWPDDIGTSDLSGARLEWTLRD